MSSASPPGQPSATGGRRWFGFIVLVAVAFFALGVGVMAVVMPRTCGGSAIDGACPKPTPDVSSPAEGVVISVDSEGLGQVRGFSLRPANSPFSLSFVLGDLENATEFPPGHLVEHQASSEPVRVYFRLAENSDRVVYRLEDATDPPGL